MTTSPEQPRPGGAHPQDHPTQPLAPTGATQPLPAQAPAAPGAPAAADPAQPHAAQPHAAQPHAAQPQGPQRLSPAQEWARWDAAQRERRAAQQQAAAPSTAGPHAGAGGGGAGTGVPGDPWAASPSGPSASERRRRRPWVWATAGVVAGVLVGGGVVAGVALDDGGPAARNERSASLADIGRTTTDEVPVAGSSADDPDWQAVAAAVRASVVAIDVRTDSSGSQGSGVIVDDDAHVVTNNHVVSAAAQGGAVTVTLTDGRIFEATVVGTDVATDLAVLRIEDAPGDLQAAALGDSDEVVVGEPVMAVGNPLGLANTVTTGIVSALDRPVSTQEDARSEAAVTNAIQIDAAVNPGNSGGPLFDAQGRVIGITSSIATLSQQSGSIGLGFAIPVNLTKNIASQLIEDGQAEHAFLGVTMSDGTATADGVTRRGAVVQTVQEGSPAAAGGLQPEDVIVAIGDDPVGGAESLTAFVRSLSSGDDVTLTVVRGGETREVDVTLSTRPDTLTTDPEQQDGQPDPGQGGGFPGDLTPEQLWEWFQQQQGR
ncbi:PDZ domain-containing protein [Cellulomonas sp. JZ18]|uniref:S1C family serine protease n=1 Tax=Cellulomonas sp. JZ18 TaxID=2654191 RepID=UPI0012D425A6|nr:trypsin-like peptidase domain-containing protein [Cellulomonas sp. JZ18]QGQ18602.1 PDZ domain-containing protein [Cellulomonas sp. JZ18]